MAGQPAEGHDDGVNALCADDLGQTLGATQNRCGHLVGRQQRRIVHEAHRPKAVLRVLLKQLDDLNTDKSGPEHKSPVRDEPACASPPHGRVTHRTEDANQHRNEGGGREERAIFAAATSEQADGDHEGSTGQGAKDEPCAVLEDVQGQAGLVGAAHGEHRQHDEQERDVARVELPYCAGADRPGDHVERDQVRSHPLGERLAQPRRHGLPLRWGVIAATAVAQHAQAAEWPASGSTPRAQPHLGGVGRSSLAGCLTVLRITDALSKGDPPEPSSSPAACHVTEWAEGHVVASWSPS